MVVASSGVLAMGEEALRDHQVGDPPSRLAGIADIEEAPSSSWIFFRTGSAEVRRNASIDDSQHEDRLPSLARAAPNAGRTGSLELPDELAHPLDAAEQFVALGDQRQCCRPQARHIFGKRVGRRYRSPGSTIFRLARRVPSASIQSVAALIASLSAARSAARAPASSRALQPRLRAAPATVA